MALKQVRKSRAAAWRLTWPRSPVLSTPCRRGRPCLQGDGWASRPLRALWPRERAPQSLA
eukprot:13022183-Alexandrium_andersonii.AAC.1